MPVAVKSLAALTIFLVGCGCAQKAAPGPAATSAGMDGGALSKACLEATVGLPAECAASLGVACMNVEDTRDDAGQAWLRPDYSCLARARSCASARACPVTDVRP